MIGKPGTRLWIAVGILALLSVGAEFLVHKHAYFEIEELPLGYAALGLAGLIAFVLAAVALRAVVGTREDFYGDGAVESEDDRGAGTEAEASHGL